MLAAKSTHLVNNDSATQHCLREVRLYIGRKDAIYRQRLKHSSGLGFGSRELEPHQKFNSMNSCFRSAILDESFTHSCRTGIRNGCTNAHWRMQTCLKGLLRDSEGLRASCR